MAIFSLSLQPVACSSSNPEHFTYAFICGCEAYAVVYRVGYLSINKNRITYNDFILSIGIQGGYCYIQLQNRMLCVHVIPSEKIAGKVCLKQ